MKKLISVLSLLLIGFSVSAQIYEHTGDLYNTTSSNPAALDSLSPGTYYLTIAGLYSGVLQTDTAQPIQLASYGRLSYVVSCWHASTTSTTNPTVVITPQVSNDQIGWANVDGASSYTVTPTSATTASNENIVLSLKPGLYNRLKLVVTNDTLSTSVTYDLQEPVSHR